MDNAKNYSLMSLRSVIFCIIQRKLEICTSVLHYNMTWLGGYKTFFKLNSTEHEIEIAHNPKMLTNENFPCLQILRSYCYHVNCWYLNIYEHDKFHAQLI